MARVLKALDWFTCASGQGVAIENPGDLPTPEILVGEAVEIDGRPFTVRQVETYAIARGENGYPAGLPIGLLVEKYPGTRGTGGERMNGLDERERPICGHYSEHFGACRCGDPANHAPEAVSTPEPPPKATDSGWEIIEWRDLDYLARVTAESHHLDFEVYEVTSWESWLNGVHQPGPHFERADASSSMDTTLDITEAEYLFRGGVKWDGCSNWSWNTDACMWHGCGFDDVINLTEAMKRVYLLASSRVDGFDAEALEIDAKEQE